MNYENNLRELIRSKDGMILTKDVEKAGIPRQYLAILVQKKELERVAQGVYLTPETFMDEMYCIQVRSGKVVFSAETALYIHDLTDRDPLVYSVTVPRGYSTNRLRETGVVVTTVKEDLYGIGLTTAKTVHGRTIKVYDVERTICDIVRNRNKMDKDMFYVALKRYSARKDKNLNRLMQYAEQFGIEDRVREYMEGLLA